MRSTLIALVITLAACAHARGAEDAQREYEGAILRMDGAAIAASFTDDGQMVTEGQEPIVGPEAIKKFLATFDGEVKVLEYETTLDAKNERDGGVELRGHYRQHVRFKNGDEQTFCGGYE